MDKVIDAMIQDGFIYLVFDHLKDGTESTDDVLENLKGVIASLEKENSSFEVGSLCISCFENE